MIFFRQTSKWALLLWVLLLSVALLCAQQGTKLHNHSLDHGHDNYQSHSHAVGGASDHRHMSKVPFSVDMSHHGHHGDVVSEIDVTPDGVLKKISHYHFSIAFVAFFFLLTVFFSLRQPVYCRRESKSTFHHYYLFSPPLRAPPQY